MEYSRQAVAAQAAQLLQDGFVLIDLETTGLDRDPNVEIVDVAIINQRGEVLLNTLVRPQGRIPPEASRINGIFDENVADAPPFAQVYDDIARHLNGQMVVAYNYTFERNILNTVCHRHSMPRFTPKEWWCAMRSYQSFTWSVRYIPLTKACTRERIRIENAHRALGDCRLTLALVHLMAAAARPTR
jgi:DNA polymerase-3 subunit epsilon